MLKKLSVVAGFVLMLAPVMALSAGMSLTAGGMWMAAQGADTSDTMNQQQSQPADTQMSREEQEQLEKSGMQSAKMREHVLAKDLIGMDIYNHQDEKLGTLKDIVFDDQHQRVSHLVLASGGFLGIFEDRYPVQWDQVQPQLSQGRVVVPIDKATLESSPTISDDESKMHKASGLLDAEVRLSSSTGMMPSQEQETESQSTQEPSRDQSESPEQTCESSDQTTAGTIDNFLISNDGQVEMAIIRPDPEFFENIEETDMVAVPWARVQINPEEEFVSVDIDKSLAPQLTVNQYELTRLEDPSFLSQIYSAVGEQPPAVALSNGSQEMIGRQPNGSQPNGQHGQSPELEKWSSFTEQCLGPDQQKASETLSGTIEDVGTLSPGENAEAPDGLQFTVADESDRRVEVYAGPRDEVASRLNISQGDDVELKGTRCQIDGEQVFVASSIRTNGTEYTLTEENGVLKWSSNGQSGSENQKEPGIKGKAKSR